jgi:recombination protein RecA
MQSVPVLPTGVAGADRVTNLGGIPRGRITEVFGPSGSGVTLLASALVRTTLLAGGAAVWVDADGTLDTRQLFRVGVPLHDLVVAQADTGERILETLFRAAETGIDLVVVDSVLNITPHNEVHSKLVDKDEGGTTSRLLGQVLRPLVARLARSSSAFVFCASLAADIRRSDSSGVGVERTRSPIPLVFYSPIRLELRRMNADEEEAYQLPPDVSGHNIRCAKNHLAAPGTAGEFFVDHRGEYLEIR